MLVSHVTLQKWENVGVLRQASQQANLLLQRQAPLLERLELGFIHSYLT
jgi:hypothetical protein